MSHIILQYISDKHTKYNLNLNIVNLKKLTFFIIFL